MCRLAAMPLPTFVTTGAVPNAMSLSSDAQRGHERGGLRGGHGRLVGAATPRGLRFQGEADGPQEVRIRLVTLHRVGGSLLFRGHFALLIARRRFPNCFTSRPVLQATLLYQLSCQNDTTPSSSRVPSARITVASTETIRAPIRLDLPILARATGRAEARAPPSRRAARPSRARRRACWPSRATARGSDRSARRCFGSLLAPVVVEFLHRQGEPRLLPDLAGVLRGLLELRVRDGLALRHAERPVEGAVVQTLRNRLDPVFGHVRAPVSPAGRSRPPRAPGELQPSDAGRPAEPRPRRGRRRPDGRRCRWS